MVLKIVQWFKLGVVTTDPISYSGEVIHKYFRHLLLIFNCGALNFQLDVCARLAILCAQERLECFKKVSWVTLKVSSFGFPVVLNGNPPLFRCLVSCLVPELPGYWSFVFQILSISLSFARIALFHSDVIYDTSLSRTLIFFTGAKSFNTSFIIKFQACTWLGFWVLSYAIGRKSTFT